MRGTERCVLGVVIGACCVLATLPGAVAAQESSPWRYVDLRAGAISAETGNRYCGAGFGGAAGVEVRTPGVPFVGLSADLVHMGSYTCLLAERGAVYQGEEVAVRGYTTLKWAPRLGATAGWMVGLGSWTLEPAASAGFVRSQVHYGRPVPAETAWRPWGTGRLTVRHAAVPLGVRVELGRHRVPQRYYAFGPPETVVREFHEWSQLLSFSLVSAPGPPAPPVGVVPGHPVLSGLAGAGAVGAVGAVGGLLSCGLRCGAGAFLLGGWLGTPMGVHAAYDDAGLGTLLGAMVGSVFTGALISDWAFQRDASPWRYAAVPVAQLGVSLLIEDWALGVRAGDGAARATAP